MLDNKKHGPLRARGNAFDRKNVFDESQLVPLVGVKKNYGEEEEPPPKIPGILRWEIGFASKREKFQASCFKQRGGKGWPSSRNQIN